MTTSSQLSPEDVQELLTRLDEQLREEKRERERISRERRAARIDIMRDQVRALGQVALTLPLLSDADEIWDAFLDPDAKRIRGLLRRLSPAVQEVQALIQEKEELQLLLKEHEQAIGTFKKLLERDAQDGWLDDVRRWKALARMAFKPLSVDQCVREVEAAVRDMEQSRLVNGAQRKGTSFLGWEESRQLRSSPTTTLDFHLRKTLRACDLDHILDTVWRAFTDQKLFSGVVHGGKARASLDILQEVSPTMLVVQFHERHDESSVTFHSLALVARVETDRTFTQIVRAIDALEVQQAMAGPCDLWMRPAVWFHWQVLDAAKPRAATDLEASLGGTITGDDPQYAQRWQIELMGALARAETVVTGKPLIDLSRSP